MSEPERSYYNLKQACRIVGISSDTLGARLFKKYKVGHFYEIPHKQVMREKRQRSTRRLITMARDRSIPGVKRQSARDVIIELIDQLPEETFFEITNHFEGITR